MEHFRIFVSFEKHLIVSLQIALIFCLTIGNLGDNEDSKLLQNYFNFGD